MLFYIFVNLSAFTADEAKEMFVNSVNIGTKSGASLLGFIGNELVEKRLEESIN